MQFTNETMITVFIAQETSLLCVNLFPKYPSLILRASKNQQPIFTPLAFFRAVLLTKLNQNNNNVKWKLSTPGTFYATLKGAFSRQRFQQRLSSFPALTEP